MRARHPEALLLTVGALTAVAGSVVVWFTVRVDLARFGLEPQTVASRGIDGSDGKTVLGLALVALLGGAATVWSRTSSIRREPIALVVLAAGLGIAALAAFDAATARDRFLDAQAAAFARDLGISVRQATQVFETLLDARVFRVSVEPGVLVTAAGGAVVTLASALTIVRARGTERLVLAGPAEDQGPA